MTQAATSESPSTPRTAGQEEVGAWTLAHSQVLPGSLLTTVFLTGSQGSQMIACHPVGEIVPPWLAGVASRAVAQREPVGISRYSVGNRAVQAISHPLYQQSMLVGAVVLLRDGTLPFTREDADALHESTTKFPALMYISPEAAKESRNPDRMVLDLVRKMCSSKDARDAAEVLSIGLAGQLECERVSIGIRHGLKTRLMVSSDAAHVFSSAGASAELQLAMDESIDQACTLVHPAESARELCVLAAHVQLADKMRSAGVCTVPLAWQGEIIGAIVAERRRAGAFSADEVAVIEQLAAASAAWLRMQRNVEMPWRKRAMQSLAEGFGKAGQGRFRLAGLAVAIALAVLFALPVDREIAAPVKLEGAIQRVITAPGDSYLEKVHVRPGDMVKAGQVLVEFASEDLRVERQRLVAEMGGREAASAEAMAKQELGALAVQASKIKESQAQLELLDQRLARMRITAPFDAVVIQGDLSNALGAPTRKGDVLMTLAPAHNFRAIVEIDESEIGEVRKGQEGAMVLTAMPYSTLPLRVKDVIPLAVVGQGRSYFEAEVELLPMRIRTDDLRPGMRGIARLSGEPRARGLVWWEHASVWLRLTWWRWIG
jgi:multidrug efflux pump subunit AcrA (membrane-fusion protein)